MLEHYFRARSHVENNGWDALRRFTFAAIGFTALAVVFAGLWEAAFYASGFLALVLWFVSLGLLVFNAEQALGGRERSRRE